MVHLQRSSSETLPFENEPGEVDIALPPGLAAALAPLAVGVLGDATEPRDQAERLVEWFRDNFTYSLQTDLEGDAHPLVVLVRERRPAYCVYFASAMVAILRTRAIPARVVGGFVPGETLPLTGVTEVRARNAHAWVEVWVPEEKRWVPFDPTPAREAPAETSAVGAVYQLLLRWAVRLRTHPTEVISGILGSRPVLGLMAAGGLWVAWRFLRGQGRTRRVRRSRVWTHPQLGPIHRRFVRILERHAGIRCAANETDEEILARLAPRVPAHVLELARQFVENWQRARYAGADATLLQGDIVSLERALRQVSLP